MCTIFSAKFNEVEHCLLYIVFIHVISRQVFLVKPQDSIRKKHTVPFHEVKFQTNIPVISFIVTSLLRQL